MKKPVFHLLANAHLDPVWLWDWREGLNEAIITSRTILDLMDDDPELTFMRGEAVLYKHIEENDPATFARIKKYVRLGRWDIVGGTWVQPDTNLPATETFARHFCLAQEYFLARFGRRARVVWSADSFGHSAGLPSIYAAAGMRGVAFTRPFGQPPIAKPAFWWQGPDGSRVLAYHPPAYAYCTERDNMSALLDGLLKAAGKQDLENVSVLYGLGNHGGGPSRRMLADIRRWAAQHPEVNLVFSTLHRFFDALYEEAGRKGKDFFPTHTGELNFCLRGCYASVAKLKYAYRRLESAVTRAERTQTAIDLALTGQSRRPDQALTEAWQATLFNSFHDILPGSSIERAYEEQLDWVGGAVHAARVLEFSALNRLAARINTQVPKPPDDHPGAVNLLVFNPHPHEYKGTVELEAMMDYRPISQYANRPEQLPMELRDARGQLLGFQAIETEHSSFPQLCWRKRVVANVRLPALGWSVFTLGWVEGARRVEGTGTAATAKGENEITNGIYTVRARPEAAGIEIELEGRPVFDAPGLGAVTVADPWGSWGGDSEEKESLCLSEVMHTWKVADARVAEIGPERARLWVLLQGGNSALELSFALMRGRNAVDIKARVLWNEKMARLKLVMPVAGESARCDVPGGEITRGAMGEMPGGRWVRVEGNGRSFGFASNALYNFDLTEGILRATIARAGHYAKTTDRASAPSPWRPVVDRGELKFDFIISPGDTALSRLAAELEQPPTVIPVSAHPGKLRRSGSLAALKPDGLKLLAFKNAENGKGWIARIQAGAAKATRAELMLLGKKIKLGALQPFQIATFRVQRAKQGFKIRPTEIVET